MKGGREGGREGGRADAPTTMMPVPAKAFSKPVATILIPMAASILGRGGGREGGREGGEGFEYKCEDKRGRKDGKGRKAGREGGREGLAYFWWWTNWEPTRISLAGGGVRRALIVVTTGPSNVQT